MPPYCFIVNQRGVKPVAQVARKKHSALLKAINSLDKNKSNKQASKVLMFFVFFFAFVECFYAHSS